jgi:DNA-binding beta-propeller fold protein YncE
MFWPPPPLEPKIQWVSSYSTADDYAISKGWFDRVTDSVFGRSPALMLRPYGVHKDSKGRLLVADPGMPGLHVFDETLKRSRIIVQGEGPLQSPIGVTADDSGSIYLTDSTRGSILKISENFTATIFADNLRRPTGIAFNPANGQIYVSDTLSGEIISYDKSGRIVGHIGSRGSDPGQFNHPTDLAVGRDGRIYVTDPLNGRIQIFSAEGTYLSSFGNPGDSSGHFAKPKGIALDSEGHIYVCDALFDTVQIFDDKGNLLLSFGDSGSRPGELWMPSGIYIDSDDRIYVTDTYNQRIQLFQYLKTRL